MLSVFLGASCTLSLDLELSNIGLIWTLIVVRQRTEWGVHHGICSCIIRHVKELHVSLDIHIETFA